MGWIVAVRDGWVLADGGLLFVNGRELEDTAIFETQLRSDAECVARAWRLLGWADAQVQLATLTKPQEGTAVAQEGTVEGRETPSTNSRNPEAS